MSKTYIGIDPGLSGALAIVSETLLRAYVMPIINVKKGKNELDLPEIKRLLQHLAFSSDVLVILEKQQSMPGQGVSTTFKIGQGYGDMRGLLTGMALAWQVVHPRTWQKVMSKDMPGGDPKSRALQAAMRLFPDMDFRKSERARKPHDGKVDAILIAEYGRRMNL